MRRTAGYTLDRLQYKYTNYKGIKNNTNFGQITGIQEKLDTKNFLILKEMSEVLSQKYIELHVMYPLFLVDLNKT